ADRFGVDDDLYLAEAIAAVFAGDRHRVDAGLTYRDATGRFTSAPQISTRAGGTELGGLSFAEEQATGNGAHRFGGDDDLHLTGALAAVGASDGDRVDTRFTYRDAARRSAGA